MLNTVQGGGSLIVFSSLLEACISWLGLIMMTLMRGTLRIVRSSTKDPEKWCSDLRFSFDVLFWFLSEGFIISRLSFSFLDPLTKIYIKKRLFAEVPSKF
jgi:hypothetical protein